MKSIVLTLKLEEIKKQREVFQRQLLLFFVFVLLLFFSTKSFGQCEMKFEYEVEKISNQERAINVVILTGGSPYTAVLYNLDSNKNEKLLTFSNNKFSIDRITPGSYALRIKNAEGCRKVVEIQIVGTN